MVKRFLKDTNGNNNYKYCVNKLELIFKPTKYYYCLVGFIFFDILLQTEKGDNGYEKNRKFNT